MAKRVLIILRRLNIGGIQTQTSLLAGEFLRRGCSVTVLVQKKSYSSTPEVTMPAGAEVYCRDFDRESKLNPFCFFSRVAAMPLLYLLSGRIGRYLVPGIFISRLIGFSFIGFRIGHNRIRDRRSSLIFRGERKRFVRFRSLYQGL